MSEALPTDLLSERAVRDPHGVFAELRAAGPAVWLPEHRAWLLTTYEAVAAGFRDARLLSSDRLTPLWDRLDEGRRVVLGDTFDLLRGWMVFHDEPDHMRLREPLRRTFTPKRVAELRPRIEQVVTEVLDDLEERRGSEVDIVAELAFPLPAIVIAELLGVPPEDRDEFKTWSDQLAAIVFGASGNPDQDAIAAAGTARFAEYFTALIETKRREPGDDLTSALIAVTNEDPESGLDPSELVGALTLLLFGGHETTTNLIGSSILALTVRPERYRRLRDEPELIETAVEELHRYDGPTKVMPRIVAADHERYGQPFRKGQTVHLGVASANHDPAAFPDPDEVILDRSDAARHLGFGSGSHFCLGAFLARVEAQATLAELTRRFGELELVETQPSWSANILGRGLRGLRISL